MNRIRFARLLALSTLVSAAAGCARLFGIHELDPGDDGGGQSDGAPPTADATMDSAAPRDATTDGATPPDAAPGDGEASLDGQAEGDAPVADTGPMADALDAPSCVDRCDAGSTQCSAKEVQTCQVGDAGCRDWVTTAACDTHQTCAVTADAGASCACNGSLCSETGTVCQDSQTVATCAKDTDSGCFYIASTSSCAPMVCSGQAPNAICSSTCSDSCTQAGLKLCVPGGLATCQAGDAGCLALGPPAMCGTNQSCTVAAGSGACTCNPPSGCSTTGNTCQAGNSSYITCTTDSDHCLVVTGAATACSNGACYGAAGSAQCCTNACSTPGSSCNGNTPVTCSAGTNGCLEVTTGTPCSGNTVCSGGNCVSAGCDGGAGQCAPGSCCNGAGTCVTSSNATCAQSGGGSCFDCTTNSNGDGPVCVGGSIGCGCNSPADCASAGLRGPSCIGSVCGCNSISDCTGVFAHPGGCCYLPGMAFSLCVANGELLSNSEACQNGAIVTCGVSGNPCCGSYCGGGLACDAGTCR